MRVAICGAGLGGLSAAVGLKALGFDVAVFERSPVLRATGAGLMLWPNGVRALYGLGLKEQIDAISVKIERYYNYDAMGDLLFEKDTSDWPAKYSASAIGVHRWALSSMLADSCGTDLIRFGHEVASVESGSDRAVCHFSNGSSYEADFIIAADGIFSAVRQKLVGGVRFQPNEHHAYRWRAIFNLEQLDIDPAAQTGFYAPGGWIAFLPIGSGKAYWFGSVSGAKNPDEFLDYFSSWTNTPISRAFSFTPKDAIIQSSLDVPEGLPEKWTHGRITLLGDAAHPPVPDLAQGAGQALIDSRVLRDVFAETRDVDEALATYEHKRLKAAYYVVKCSQQGSFLGRNKVDPIVVRYEREIEAMGV
ncbi:FAD-dependent monooxygenase [Bradyrhizobium sp. 38]|uniref:FAD-dependent monooxygenase n=1 Tax=unclassified Bradyrhizobium TaxID=2631580 RepID=UPI001FFC146E|nr:MULTISPECIES: NAD(P)/FAD-dependent oxidoreductase [unclassified Bradyrhizobium]MCK1336669.1 FAD-dependent monooxygenase [Bradyrhizobium sp. 38]MCK1777019.1 FAD-dependent monooxygenase [Bradyrhizobium sp. 132]